MKAKLLILLFSVASSAYSQQLPTGVTTKSFDCTYAIGQTSNYYYKGDQMIGKVEPSSCFYSETEGGRVNPLCYTEFYLTQQKDTFSTKKEATAWLIKAMEEFYKPVAVTKWQNLRIISPNIKLKYPWDWDYKLSKYDGIFKSKSLGENKISLIKKDPSGSSEICVIFRTPNTAALTTQQVIDISKQMNGAINLKNNPLTNYSIGGKTFKSSENEFTSQMDQHHFWYADEKEIIYIYYNLLKNERTWYDEVMKKIIESITW